MGAALDNQIKNEAEFKYSATGDSNDRHCTICYRPLQIPKIQTHNKCPEDVQLQLLLLSRPYLLTAYIQERERKGGGSMVQQLRQLAFDFKPSGKSVS